VVREDPARRGLVYAGTETGAHVSFDGGDHWQPLQLNCRQFRCAISKSTVRTWLLQRMAVVSGRWIICRRCAS